MKPTPWKYIGVNQYRYRSFFDVRTGCTKIIINMFLDEAAGFIGLTEIDVPERLTEKEADREALAKVAEIENLE